MILVIGGTGNVGGALVGELLKRGANVRVLARKHSGEGNLPAGVELAIGDLLDPVSLEKALLGVDKLYLLNAVAPDELIIDPLTRWARFVLALTREVPALLGRT